MLSVRHLLLPDMNKIAETMRVRQSREVVTLPAKRVAEKQAS
jgi:hypothetical protein